MYLQNNDSCDPSDFVYKCSKMLRDASCSNLTCSLSEIQKAVHVKIFHGSTILIIIQFALVYVFICNILQL